MATQNVFYRELLDNLYDGVFFVDSNKTITYWNRAAENITGYTCDDVVGKCCSDNILVHVDEKGAPLCDSGCPLQAVIEDGKSRESMPSSSTGMGTCYLCWSRSMPYMMRMDP